MFTIKKSQFYYKDPSKVDQSEKGFISFNVVGERKLSELIADLEHKKDELKVVLDEYWNNHFEELEDSIADLEENKVDKVTTINGEDLSKSFVLYMDDIPVSSSNTTGSKSYTDKIVSDETTRATEKENELNNTINAETTRATAKETELKQSIEKEVERATKKEGEIDADIATLRSYTDTEIYNTKKYADNAADTVKNDLLNGAGAAYDTLRELGELIDDNADAIDILNEISATKAAQTDLENEIKRATESEETLQTNIDTKMNKENPEGTGSFSLNRKSGSTVGNYSFAAGYDAVASGEYSFSVGEETTASGQHSFAVGDGSVASGKYSVAFGNNGHASAGYSYVEGYACTATKEAAHAEGWNTKANGNYSHAEGYITYANGDYSHAEGLSTKAASDHQHVQGKYNIEDTSDTYAHIIGNGTYNNPSNAHTVDWSGNAWYAGDVYVKGSSQDDTDARKLVTTDDLDTKSDINHIHDLATQETSGIMSAEDKLRLDYGGIPIATAYGNDNFIYTATVNGVTELKPGFIMTIIPDKTCTEVYPILNLNNLGEKYIFVSSSDIEAIIPTVKIASDWMKQGSPITLQYNGHDWIVISVSQPRLDDCWGVLSIKQGGTGATSVEEVLENLRLNDVLNNKIDKENPEGTGSFSLNRRSDSTIGEYSVATGYNTAAIGTYSYAEGLATTAGGQASHVEGVASYAGGNYSHAEGVGSRANGECQHVQGQFNIEDKNNVYAHIVGNGKAEDQRSNIHTLDWDGNAWFAGDVYVGGTSQDDTNVKKLSDMFDSKVDKTEGYSLVANTEIERLAFVDNYDDSDLSNRVTTLESEVAMAETLNNYIPLPKNEEGNVITGENGQILQSNGDGTYSWTSTVLLGKFYLKELETETIHSFIYEIGMTWEEFINSNCNIGFSYSNSESESKLCIDEFGIRYLNNIYYNSSGNPSDTIINGYTYEPVITIIEEVPLA